MKKIFFLVILLIILGGAGLWALSGSSIKKELDSCRSITEEPAKSRCFTKLAVEERDYDLCNNIEVASTRGYCEIDVAGVKGDLSYCYNKAREGQADSCFRSVAIGTLDESKCELMSEFMRNGQGPYTSCYSQVAILKEKPSVCEGLRQGYRDGCYFDYAVSKKDKSVCEKILSTFERDQCLRTIETGIYR